MESSEENMEISEQQIIQEPMQSVQSKHKVKSKPQNKKIKKRHRKKKGKISRHQNENQSIINQALSKNSKSLEISKAQGIQKLKKKMKSSVHIKNILRNQVGLCYKDNKDGSQCKDDIYKELLKTAGQYPIIDKIGLKKFQRGSSLMLNYLRDIRDMNQRHHFLTSHRLLSQNEFTLLIKRPYIMSQIVTFIHQYGDQNGFQIGKMDPIIMQIITLCKLNAEVETDLFNGMNILEERPDPLQNFNHQVDQNQTDFLQDEYTKALTLKNLEHSFKEDPIDFLNYHKSLELLESNNFEDSNQEKIRTLNDFKKYIQSRKPKIKKRISSLLRTPCSACFSDISQSSNLIINCPQCRMRVHERCQNVNSRCHRCKYGRTGNSEKHQTGYCYICHRQCEKGLMIFTVTKKSPHKYAHNYCLLLHNSWNVKNKACIGTYFQYQNNKNKCTVCEKQGLLMQCVNCKSLAHGICAYLDGYSFRMKRGESLMDYKIEINCCINPQLRKRLKHERRFKLNIQKIIFRQKQNEQLLNYIEDRMEVQQKRQ